VSSIAAAGLYEGVFREDMFEQAENYEHTCYKTKHEMGKFDGPFYFFKLIQCMRPR